MAWPQAPQPPQPGPAPASKPLPLGGLVAGVSALLTLLFSFVQIAKPDIDVDLDGWSVWTTDVGLFGVGTWIPLFALLAGLIALARALTPALDDKEVLGFGPLQVQIAALAFAVLIWLGYMVNILLADFVTFGLGAFLLFLGLAGIAAGTGLGLAGTKTPSAPGTPAAGSWPPQSAPTGPAGPAPAVDPYAPAAPGQWQPDPAGSPVPPPPPEQGWQQPSPPQQQPPFPQAPAPPPSPAPPDPQAPSPPPPPAPGGGALIDPGTQVIPGPPPAPPPDEIQGPPPGYPPVPPPSNT